MNEQSIEGIFKNLNSNNQTLNDLLRRLNKKDYLAELIEKFRNKYTFSDDKLYEYDKFVDEMNDDPLFKAIDEFKESLKNVLDMKNNDLNGKLINEFGRAREEYLEKKKGFKLTAYYNGNNYIGNFKNSKKEGLGYYYDKSGYHFYGEWEQDNHKEGILMSKKEDRIEYFFGKFSYNQNQYDFEGLYLPVYVNKNDNVSLIYGKFDNKHNIIEGLFVFENEQKEKDVYLGQMSNFEKNDPKSLSFKFNNLNPKSTLSLYKGPYSENKRNGKGLIIDFNSKYLLEVFYENDTIKTSRSIFLMNKDESFFHGDLVITNNNTFSFGNTGKILFVNNHMYTGNLKKGLKEGPGKYYIPIEENFSQNNYVLMEGKFENDKFISGKIVQKDEKLPDKFIEIFSGDFHNNQPLKGLYSYTKTETYQGNFKDGMRDGTGKYCFHDKSYYEGSWKENKKHGEGTYFDSENNLFKGVWENDQIKEIKDFIPYKQK